MGRDRTVNTLQLGLSNAGTFRVTSGFLASKIVKYKVSYSLCLE